MHIRSGLAISLALAAFLGASSVAEARLENPQPQQGPIQVSGANLVLVFSAGVDLPSSAVEIRDSADRKIEIGKLQLQDNGTNIKIPLKAALRPGVYTLSWRAVSNDGRESVGSYAVTIDPIADHTPTVAEK
jgi:methionine-rich copper-binding protein CopC